MRKLTPVALLGILLLMACRYYPDEYSALVNYGRFVCSDRPWTASCDNTIPAEDVDLRYRYEFPKQPMNRVDAQIFYWKMAEEKYPERDNHKALLLNSLRIRARSEDAEYIQRLASIMKQRKIPEGV